MKSKNTFCLTVNMELLRSLQEDRQKDCGRLSRYSAFVYLLEHANRQSRTVTAFGQKIYLSAGQLVTSYSELAAEWKWSRDNVRNFFLALETSENVSIERRGKATIISLPFRLTDNIQMITPLPTKDERDRLRLIFGAMSLEEMTEMLETAISEAQQELDKERYKNINDIGRRLHRLVNHLILHPSGVLPKDTKVENALRSIFIENCDSDLTKFFALLSIGGIKLVNGRNEIAELPLTFPDRTIRLLAVVLEYYSPFIRQRPLSDSADTGISRQAMPETGTDVTPHPE